MMIRSRSAFQGSTAALPRSRRCPRPVSYISRIGPNPHSVPPVGKSGPFTNCIRSATVASGWSIRWIVPSTISPRLCGGMLVAMPTAMPVEPLTSRFGMRAGSTLGSSSFSS